MSDSAISDRRRDDDAQRFLAEASAVLASSLDPAAILAATARLAVPRLADWSAVHLVPPDRVRRILAVAHRNPARTHLVEALARHAPLRTDEPGLVAEVVRAGRSRVVHAPPRSMLQQWSADPEALAILEDLGPRDLLLVPLTARTQVLGAITMARAEHEHGYEPDELGLAEELARRAGAAVENALLYQQAQDNVRVRDEFLSIASHELRTPLTTLQLTIQSLERSTQAGTMPSPRRLGTALDSIARQSRRLAALVDELLDVTRIRSGRLQLELAEVDLGTVLRDVAQRFAEDLVAAGCTLRLGIPPDALVGRWDRARVEQVVTNLLSNAIKYGGGTPIDVVARREAPWVVLTVRDGGIGIPPELLPRIFDRFERGVSARNYGGLGLGLYIVKQVLEAHGASIRVESTLGRGTTFEVRLPL